MPPGDVYPGGGGASLLHKENSRLRAQIAKLESTQDRKAEQLRILENLVSELQKQNAELKSGKGGA